ncbi:hypothetical protein B0H14DRAFT_3517223 [Mycena olivaceomarginata]|nr:hypothetical protein B0H14DRAFT_3517223 [Mycena olivaceomarginata]
MVIDAARRDQTKSPSRYYRDILVYSFLSPSPCHLIAPALFVVPIVSFSMPAPSTDCQWHLRVDAEQHQFQCVFTSISSNTLHCRIVLNDENYVWEELSIMILTMQSY